MNPTCCNKNAEIKEVNHECVDGFGIHCNVCNHAIFHVDKDEAIKIFMDTRKKEIEVKKTVNNNNRIANRGNELVPSRNNIVVVLENRKNELSNEVLPILSNDRGAVDRLLKNNTVKYVNKMLSDEKFNKVSPESMIYEVEEATIMGAELGKMGDIIPFGSACQFIPSIEAYESSLTNGINAPFHDINIKCIYEGDEPTSGIKNGDFFIDIKDGPIKEVAQSVAVWGTLAKTGKIIGEIYSAKRLLEKAEGSSKPFQKYLKYKRAYEFQKSEGKTEFDMNGRESFKYYESAKSDDPYHDKSVAYFKNAEANNQLKSDSKGDYAVQSIPKKAGGTFEKKIYRYEVEGGSVATTMFIDELSNPYGDANQPEMLRKTAGKSFLRRFSKVRNSEAAMHEVNSSKGAREECINMTDDQFVG